MQDTDEEGEPPPRPASASALPPLESGSKAFLVSGVGKLRGCVAAARQQWKADLADFAGEEVEIASHTPPLVRIHLPRHNSLTTLPEAALRLSRPSTAPADRVLSPLDSTLMRQASPGRYWVQRKGPRLFKEDYARAQRGCVRALLKERGDLEGLEILTRAKHVEVWFHTWKRVTDGAYALTRLGVEKIEEKYRKMLQRIAAKTFKPMQNEMERSALFAEHAVACRRHKMAARAVINGLLSAWPEQIPLPGGVHNERMDIVRENRKRRAFLTDHALQVNGSMQHFVVLRSEEEAFCGIILESIKAEEKVQKWIFDMNEIASRHAAQRAIMERLHIEGMEVVAREEDEWWGLICDRNMWDHKHSEKMELNRVEDEAREVVAWEEGVRVAGIHTQFGIERGQIEGRNRIIVEEEPAWTEFVVLQERHRRSTGGGALESEEGQSRTFIVGTFFHQSVVALEPEVRRFITDCELLARDACLRQPPSPYWDSFQECRQVQLASLLPRSFYLPLLHSRLRDVRGWAMEIAQIGALGVWYDEHQVRSALECEVCAKEETARRRGVAAFERNSRSALKRGLAMGGDYA
eukprot:Hpha_TRINITY_DN18718_c0_g1::TRINITY_DN18718_c0_g1_i1::g.47452::m.47452